MRVERNAVEHVGHEERRDYVLIRPDSDSSWLVLGPAVDSTWESLRGELVAQREEDVYGDEPTGMEIRLEAFTGAEIAALDEFRGW